jgi:hypothetical protein
MISSLLFDKTAPDVRLDGPIEATVHIPLNVPRTVLRLLSLLLMAGGAVFALVTVAIHFEDPGFLIKNAPAKDLKDVMAAMDATIITVRTLQILIAAATLLFAIFSMLRLFMLVQSHESGLTVGPRGITVACDLRSANPQRIAWRSIRSIETSKPQGILNVVLHLRSPDDTSDDNRRFRFWPGSRVTIPTRSLRIKHTDLTMLLDRYFAQYAVPQSPSSKEAS